MDEPLPQSQSAAPAASALSSDRAGDSAPAAGAAGKQPPEPGSEIWFRRRISLGVALREAWRFRELTLTLAERDLRVRYKQAFLGIAWALFTPVVLMLIFTFLFTKFGRVETAGLPYPLFAYLGLIPWTFFSSAVLSGGMSLVSNMMILNKVYCPREVFPLATLVVAAVDAAVASVVLVVLFVVEDFAPKPEALYAPVFLPALVMFTLGVTMGVAAVLVYVRDLRHALPLIVQFWLFATPIAYGAFVIADTRAKLLLYSAVNPLVPVIQGLRRTVLLGLGPQWETLAVGTASSAIILAVGYWLFKRLETGIADIA